MLLFGIVLGFALATTFIDVTLWVRGVAGKARGLVLGAAPASKAPSSKEGISPAATEFVPDRGRHEVSPTPPNKPIEAWKGFLAGVGNMASFAIRHPVLLIGIALVAFWLIAGSSCARLPFGKSNDALRIERELAEQEVRTQEQLRERDAAIAEIRNQTAVQLAQIRLESQRGRDAIAAATPEHEEPIDPGLVAAWRDALDGLCVARVDGNRPDSCGP